MLNPGAPSISFSFPLILISLSHNFLFPLPHCVFISSCLPPLSFSPNSYNRKVDFVKVYEDHNETEGYEVEYTGVLDKEGCMRGKWNNKKGGSYGEWLCRQQV